MFLLLTMAATMVALPTSTAHDPAWNVPTYAFLNVEPNPVGIGQTVFVTFWLDKVPPTANVAFGDRWENMTVKVTKPDGTTQNYGPFSSDDVGASYMTFIPDALGTYKFQFIFPGQIIAGANPAPTGTNNAATVGDYYMPSQTQEIELVVQQDAIEPWPGTPLPENNYWQRPVNGMNPEWTTITGDWLMSTYDGYGNCYNPYTYAPDSAHIVWTYPLAYGGVNGGEYADWNYYTGLAYETKFSSGIIMYGRLYFNVPMSTSANAGGTTCIDLRTGEQIWYQSGMRISFGQEFDYYSPNQFGIIPYLWQTGSTYNFYDPYNGQWLFCLQNASTGTTVFGPNGELLVYNMGRNGNWLSLWNSTKAIMHYQQPGVLPGGNVWQWRPLMQTTMDWNYGIEWNVTTTPYNQTIPGSGSTTYQSIKKITPDVILATTVGSWSIPYDWEMEIGYSAKDGSELWAVNRTEPISWNTLQGSPAGDGVYTEFHPETMTWYGYDIYTGEELWGPTEPYHNAFGVYSWQARIADGVLYAASYGGYLYAYDVKTGDKLWDFYAGDSGVDTVYGSWPLNSPIAIADGKVYVMAGHAYNPPLFKGAKVYCINATTGEGIWDSLGFYVYNGIAIADGFMTLYNSYDGQIYCYGKGQSATTVYVQNDVISLGNEVLIKGTVTDQSPGDTCLGVPAAGTPAISDADMGDWMAYLYMQQSKPADATGVQVHLTAIDPNGNFQDIGTAISDDAGCFTVTYKPPVPGVYAITAEFEGSGSYFMSRGETAIYVTEASAAPAASVASTPTPPTPATAQPTSASATPAPTTQTPVPAPVTQAAPTYETIYIVGAAIAVIAVVAAAALLLRRRR
ncbi:MAG: PQQ-binding-like beta-propeller repeat protein [Candidatus Bathyarchaeota archaeon]|nr:PQQ-binding-like beta-propeller repeat protein [Candidatus Bathyarchaeota archaeon]